MNNSRRLVIALGAAASMPHTVFAQAKKPPVLIGLLGNGSRNERTLAAFTEGMAALVRTLRICADVSRRARRRF